MPIEFQCAQCSKVLRVPDGSAGKKAKCPSCAAIVEVPAATAQPTDDEYKVAPLGQPSSPAPDPNPFADAKGSSPFAEKSFDPKNPYASPSYSSVTKPGLSGSDEFRTGPPWERDGQNVSSFVETAREIYSQTTSTFATMRRTGGLGAPMGFAVLGNIVGIAAAFFYQFVVQAIQMAEDPEAIGVMVGVYCFYLVCTPVGVIIGLFIQSFITHLMLMLVGGTDRGFDTFETTFRVVAYCGGATALAAIIPCVGGCIQFVVGLVFPILGLAAAHETSTGKAAAAVLLPIVICGAAAGVLVVLILAAGAAGGGGF
jgi:phage FluMu protein Com